jgi:hypothetical protein
VSKVGLIRITVVVVWLVLIVHLLRDRGVLSDFTGTVPPDGSHALMPSSADEAWMGVYMKDHKIGYTHHRFVPSGEGYSFTQESMLRMKVMDTNQTVHVTVKGETGPDYALRRFEASLRSGVGDFAARGAIQGEELVLTIDTAGEEATQRLSIGGPIYLANGARQALAHSDLTPGLRLSTQVFDPSTMQYQPMESTVEARESLEIHGNRADAWRVREEFRSLVSTVWIDDKGHVLKEAGPLGLVALRETPEEALSAGWKGDVPFDLIAAVAVPVAAEIPRPREVRHLKLRIRGISDVSVPVDNRQAFEDGCLVVEQEGKEAIGTFMLPYEGDPWRTELSPTAFMQIEHPRVREAARQAVAGETDARRAAEAIRKWVYSRLDKVPTASIPNALQVLDMGEGDCNEHAVLYAAMCRAVGLPARVVAGAVYTEGVFLYHAWNEVWLGSGWVSVDSSFDQMPADATHIKFLEGGPEVHDGMLRVIGRLSIEVVAFH